MRATCICYKVIKAESIEEGRGTKREVTDMFAYEGGTTARRGTYWNLSNGMREVLERDGMLPGTKETKYLKAAPIVMVVLGPVVGFFYVLTLPVIGMAMIVTLLARRVGEWVAGAIGTTAAFGWRPVEAYLMSRKKKAEHHDDSGQGDPQADK